MLDAPNSFLRDHRITGLLWLLLTLAGVCLAANWILSGSAQDLIMATLVIMVAAILLTIFSNWRSGFYFFLVWLLFEDLARKYMGNNMLIYFGKDALVGVAYVSFFIAVRKGQAALFRPRFLIPILLFFCLVAIQVLNPASPHMLYGLIGLKLYFYYVPLMFLGYSLVQSGEALRKFLIFNLCLATVIALLGAIQAVRGPEFLNPSELESNIRSLATLKRIAPISGAVVYRPTSVFVSDGRFAWYLILMWLVGSGAAGYLLLSAKRGRVLTFLSLGIITAALILTGSRGGILWTGGSALVVTAAFLWGAPWKQREALRVIKTIRNGLLVCGLGLALMVWFIPEALGARWAFYSETLLPSSRYSELSNRVGDYPLQNLLAAFRDPRWLYGNGTGTNSLGVQYVSQFLHVAPPTVGVESGFGSLVIETGILGLVLWIVWTVALLLSAWGVVRRLKGTPYFPIAFSIFWFAFLLLLPFTYQGMAPYQNFVLNAYLWLLVGMLFSLPNLAAGQMTPQVRAAPIRAR